MSMFHELMMRKKEQTMYATIKGTLTESPEGVFSGFAYNKYLVTQEEFDYSKDFEIVVKTNTGNLSLTSYKIIIRSNSGSNAGATGCAIGIENQRLRIYLINSEGGFIANGSFGVSSFVNDADYFFKFSQKIDNGIYTIKLETSTDGINWTIENSWTSSLPIRNSGQGIAFGGGGFSSTLQSWTGSIDLNRSYIKLGSTKYNLQAVVGYTVVGSPTITDGVVSGFNASNYLTLPNINISEGTPFNIITKISTPADYQGNWLLAFVTNSSRIYCLSRAPVFRYLSNGTATNLSFNYTMAFNTTYILEIKYDGTNLKVIIYDENNNILSTNEVEDTKVVFFNGSYTIGNNKSNQFFNGSIDMNETEIKINNKLWFNGQQA